MLPMTAQILPGPWALDVAAPRLTDNKITDNFSRPGCQINSTRGGEARRGDHRARTREGALASCSNPRDAPAPFAIAIHAFLPSCTCLLFVRSTLCGSLVPVATKDLAGCRLWSHLLVLLTKSCHVCFTSAYCVALSNEMSTRGLDFALES